MNQSHLEVLAYLHCRKANKLPKTKNLWGFERVYKRHQKAFDELRAKGYTTLDAGVWALTIEGFEKTRVMRTVLIENGIKPDRQDHLRGYKAYYQNIVESKIAAGRYIPRSAR